jgi:6-phosphogluconate dehydrogenase
MKFGMIGLGRMGGNLALQAIVKGHDVVGYNRDAARTDQLAREGLIATRSLEELVEQLESPRVVVIFVPHGDPTEQVCDSLRPLLERGDIVVDGGNSHWRDSVRRHGHFAEAGVRFMDVGTSGGVSGARSGACFMAGGDREAFEQIEGLLRDLAVDDAGVVFAGPPGAGHFVKLVHNAIEFGMVQAIAEGVELLERSDYQLDLPALFENWNHGSVIRSWLVELMGAALRGQPDLGELSPYVEDTGEVKWVLEWALDQDIPSPVISQSQQALMDYRDLESPAAKAVALLRHGYGGHPIHRTGKAPNSNPNLPKGRLQAGR